MLASVKRSFCVFALVALFTASLGAQEPNLELKGVVARAEQGDANAQFNLGLMYYPGFPF